MSSVLIATNFGLLGNGFPVGLQNFDGNSVAAVAAIDSPGAYPQVIVLRRVAERRAILASHPKGGRVCCTEKHW